MEIGIVQIGLSKVTLHIIRYKIIIAGPITLFFMISDIPIYMADIKLISGY